MNILVIGSINIDEVHYIKKFPLPGETIIANQFSHFYGGKGANQAIAMKRLAQNPNHKVMLFAKVGNDSAGRDALTNLKQNNVDPKYVQISTTKPTGKATILISYLEGDNQIILNKGANEDFSESDLEILAIAIQGSDLIVLQLEVNDYLVDNALKIAKQHQKIVIMNPAPATYFRDQWLPYIDYFIPNETELETIANQRLNNLSEIELALEKLRQKGLKNALVTLGDAGAYLSSPKLKKWFAAKKMKVIDTTAAGDTFVGGFIAYHLLGVKDDIIKNLDYVLTASALTIAKRGAQESIPTWKEVASEKNKANQ